MAERTRETETKLDEAVCSHPMWEAETPEAPIGESTTCEQCGREVVSVLLLRMADGGPALVIDDLKHLNQHIVHGASDLRWEIQRVFMSGADLAELSGFKGW